MHWNTGQQQSMHCTVWQDSTAKDQHSTARHSPAQRSPAHHSTAQHQHSTASAQHSTQHVCVSGQHEADLSSCSLASSARGCSDSPPSSKTVLAPEVLPGSILNLFLFLFPRSSTPPKGMPSAAAAVVWPLSNTSRRFTTSSSSSSSVSGGVAPPRAPAPDKPHGLLLCSLKA